MSRSVTPFLLYGFNLGEAYWDNESSMDWISKDEDGYRDGDLYEDLEKALLERVAGFTEAGQSHYSTSAYDAYSARYRAAKDGLGLEVVALGWLEAEDLFALVAKKITDHHTEDPFKTMIEFDYHEADRKLWDAVSVLHIPVADQVPHWWLDFNIG